MYKVEVQIRGTTPLLQHRFSLEQLSTLMQGATKRTGAPDYSLEWLGTMYVTQDGYLYQPAAQIEGALVAAGKLFKVKGQRSKTWKDAIRAYCYVVPDEIRHLRNGEPIHAPGAELLTTPREGLAVDVRRVRVSQAAVARSRLMIAAGWELAFTIEVHDAQVPPDILKEILAEAGRAVGIGDFRPRYGRFEVCSFAGGPEKVDSAAASDPPSPAS